MIPGWSYGAPIVAYPSWYPEPGIIGAASALAFGIGFGIGFFGGFGWGWGHWDMTGTADEAFFDHHAFVSHSHEFGHEGFHHGDFGHGGAHGGGFHGSSSFHGARASDGGFQLSRRSRERALGRVHWLLIHGGNVAEGFHPAGGRRFGGASHGGGFHGGRVADAIA